MYVSTLLCAYIPPSALMVLMSVTPTTELLVFELFQKLPCTRDTLVSYSGE